MGRSSTCDVCEPGVTTDRAGLRYSDGSGSDESVKGHCRFVINRGLDGEALAKGIIRNTKAACEANARLIAASPDGLAVAKKAYLALLCIPSFNRVRGQIQVEDSLLAELRDYIASATGREAEDVQNEYEERRVEALEGRQL